MTPREPQSGCAARISATRACLRDQVKVGMLMIESAVLLGREERSADHGHGGRFSALHVRYIVGALVGTVYFRVLVLTYP